MAAPDLKGLLERLTLDQQARILLVFAKWMIQDESVRLRQGRSPMPEGGLDSLINLDPGFEARLARAVQTGDKAGLKAGLGDVFRGLPRIQKEPSAGRFNAFLRAHLEAATFDALYRAAGLDPSALAHDPAFPTDWPGP